MAKIESTLLDNTNNFKLVDKIKQLLNEDDVNEVLIATGYWDIPGTALIANELSEFLSNEGKSVKLLIGKEPVVYEYQIDDSQLNEIKTPTKEVIKIKLSNLTPKSEYYDAVQLLRTYCDGDNPKFSIHSFENPDDKRQFFHSKCYIFAEKVFTPDNKDHGLYAIVGSSNFTERGLEDNSELNYLEIQSQVIDAHENDKQKGHIEWFKEKWESSKDWTKEFLLALNNSPIGLAVQKLPVPKPSNNDFIVLSPKEAYYKLLISQFNSYLEYDGKIKPEDYIPADPNFIQLSYQLQAVNQAFGILEKHHGMILADVVGLGKTYTALMIVKRYLIESGFSKSVLIITPPPIKKNWEDSIAYFDKDAKKTIKDHIVLTTIGTLDTESSDIYSDETEENQDNETKPGFDDFDDSFVPDDYGMVVVDESHHFRNSATIAYQKLEDLLFEKKPYTVLLSATPQNNRPSDIVHQLYLFEHDHRHSTLTGLGSHGNNLESYFSTKEKIYEECIRDWSSKRADGTKIFKGPTERKRDMQTLKTIADEIRDDVLNQIVIRRTRTDLQSDLYREDIKKQGIVFPEITPPKGIPYEMTGSLAQLFTHTLDVIAPKVAHIDVDDNGVQEFDFRDENEYLHYYRYRAIEYLDPKYHKIYAYDSRRKRDASGSITVEGISDRLAGLMELHLVKRLESSRAAFEESLNNLYTNTKNMIKMFEKGRIFICPDFDIHKIINSFPEHEMDKAFEQIKVKAINMNAKHQTQKNAEYKPEDFRNDYLSKLINDARLIEALVEQWSKNRQDKKRDAFIKEIESQFLDKKNNPEQKMVVFTECIATQDMLYDYLNDEYPEQVLKITADNRKDFKELLDANFDANYKGTPQDKYRILVTTDVLAEGVNLHRANTLVNYDSPWNSTRLMQRLGRINRIGSKSDKIFSYNFYPSTLGDNQINLYKRTLVKLQAFHNMFGEDSQIYTTDEEMVEIQRPDFEESESLDPKIEFITELRDFKETQQSKYDNLCSIKNSKTIVTAVHNETNPNTANAIVENVFLKVQDKVYTYLNQIEFCKRIKELSDKDQLELSDKQYSEFKNTCVVAYQTKKSNESVNIKPDVKKNEKDRKAAIEKLKKLGAQYTIDNVSRKLVSDVETSVRNKNIPLIRKILADNCDNLLELDSTIQAWHNLLSNKDNEEIKNPKLYIEFIEN